MPTLLSYKNDEKLKKIMIEEMLLHQKQDQLIKGRYSKTNGIFKGCAVGCSIHSLNIRLGKEIPYHNHSAYETELGLPAWLAKLEDTIFEGLPDDEAKKFPLEFLQAIPVGVNLEPVKWKFSSFILKENIERVLSLKIKESLKKQVIEALQNVLALHENAIKTEKWDDSAASAAQLAASTAWSATMSAAWSTVSAAWSAASAAESAASAASAAWSTVSAAWSAAESAAWSTVSAAWSAAWSAAESAKLAARSAGWLAKSSARSATFLRYRAELLRLLKEAK